MKPTHKITRDGAASFAPTGQVERSQFAQSQSTHGSQVAPAALDDYKMGLLEEFRTESAPILRFATLALNEAESLAWSTPFACLVLPVLAEEKLVYARQWVARQRRLTQGLAVVALAIHPQPNRRKEPPQADHQDLGGPAGVLTHRVDRTCIGINEHRTPATLLKLQP